MQHTPLNKHINICMLQIEPLLMSMDESTCDLAINMMTYTQFPIEGAEDITRITKTLVNLASTLPSDDNPVVIAARKVMEMYEIVHGQASYYAQEAERRINIATQQLISGVLEALQLIDQQYTA